MDHFKPLVTVFICIVMFAIASLLYSNYTARQTGKKFCDSVGIIVEAYKDPKNEPKNEVGRKFKDSYEKLYDDLGC